MDWKDLSPLIGRVAPTLGKIVGGFLPLPFGGAIGESAGRTIALALGVPDATPEAVRNTISNIPETELRQRLSTLEASAVAQYQAMAEMAKADATVQVEQVKATAATISQELVVGNFMQRLWRPAAMCVWVATWPVQLGGLFYAITSHDAVLMGNLPTLVTALAAWNAAPAALAGVYSWGRTQEKIAVARNGGSDV